MTDQSVHEELGLSGRPEFQRFHLSLQSGRRGSCCLGAGGVLPERLHFNPTGIRFSTDLGPGQSYPDVTSQLKDEKVGLPLTTSGNETWNGHFGLLVGFTKMAT